MAPVPADQQTCSSGGCRRWEMSEARAGRCRAGRHGGAERCCTDCSAQGQAARGGLDGRGRALHGVGVECLSARFMAGPYRGLV